jgi:hypothetical protein
MAKQTGATAMTKAATVVGATVVVAFQESHRFAITRGTMHLQARIHANAHHTGCSA